MAARARLHLVGQITRKSEERTAGGIVIPPYAAVATPGRAVEDAAAAPIWRAAFWKSWKDLPEPVFRSTDQGFSGNVKNNLLPSRPAFTANTIPWPQWGMGEVCPQ